MLRRTISFLILAGSLRAEKVVIDRVAAAAGQQVVTLSAIRRHLRILALVDNSPLEDTQEARRKAADRLIDQALIHREIELSRFNAPTRAEAEARIQTFQKQRNLTQQQFDELLQRYGFTEDDFTEEVLWRISVTRFIDFRFSPGVQITDDEIKKYYTDEFLPQFRRRAPDAPLPPLDDVRDRVSQVLMLRKTNQAVDQWLAQMRTTVKVRYFEAVLGKEELH
ncbi:SurA N-terminal domain-containing protein [uncultured Paludibaculum sp.]|uniref:SurA N-terminal domain-containing protein n=1 Tax=uncultured Paludibaculum sp. TaxID=1765020 RepID=UPI002AAAD9C4|nr:SurA N-terminal domain-containing protein [uncultured Paludibaculum sp.]